MSFVGVSIPCPMCHVLRHVLRGKHSGGYPVVSTEGWVPGGEYLG